MSGETLYLYAFVGRGGAEVSELEGVEEGRGVAVIDCGGLDAVVSRVSLEEYKCSLGETEPADPAWVIPRALRHEGVVTAVAAGSAALPIRFGTVFSSAEAVEQMAALHRDQILAFLDEVEGKEEWSFKVEYDSETATENALQTVPELAVRFQCLASTPGTRFFKEKTLRAEARVVARRAAVTAALRLHDRLHTLAECRDLPPGASIRPVARCS